MRQYLNSPHLSFKFKQNSADFFVEEIPLIASSQKGRFLLVKVKKENLSSWQLFDIFANYCNCKVGYAGLKDKNATTIQYLTLDEKCYKQLRRFKHLKIEILSIEKTKKPLKMGDLAGNRFRIHIYNVNEYTRLQEALSLLEQYGVPNYFGYQRFGKESLQQAKDFIEGEYFTKNKRLQKLLASIYQSDLFNRWLIYRVKLSSDTFLQLPGDVYVKDGRYITSKEIVNDRSWIVTGLLPGKGAFRARGKAREIEKHYDEPLPFRGDRRPALFFPKDVEVTKRGKRVTLHFTLPKGSYATILLENLAGKELTAEGI
ncbi:tRNA pseudouridine(13) synthase TruD [Nitratiruptor sp. YY09-18]|uniref:tRNA pseudouridine(13) synthase TruD n=1 Tax=Nitratiruptor sp. YY09-18 TaxID=2724901 RepID=UPI00191674BD|nr:tRNA pseudouridine(13) synthase TruD [Nitratiruptor sp. YY09-18]BCD67772.1 tRNA pseudouridine13 synthase [Nitratiruptor sp. YY09-18]